MRIGLVLGIAATIIFAAVSMLVASSDDERVALAFLGVSVVAVLAWPLVMR